MIHKEVFCEKFFNTPLDNGLTVLHEFPILNSLKNGLLKFAYFYNDTPDNMRHGSGFSFSPKMGKYYDRESHLFARWNQACPKAWWSEYVFILPIPSLHAQPSCHFRSHLRIYEITRVPGASRRNWTLTADRKTSGSLGREAYPRAGVVWPSSHVMKLHSEVFGFRVVAPHGKGTPCEMLKLCMTLLHNVRFPRYIGNARKYRIQNAPRSLKVRKAYGVTGHISESSNKTENYHTIHFCTSVLQSQKPKQRLRRTQPVRRPPFRLSSMLRILFRLLVAVAMCTWHDFSPCTARST